MADLDGLMHKLRILADAKKILLEVDSDTTVIEDAISSVSAELARACTGASHESLTVKQGAVPKAESHESSTVKQDAAPEAASQSHDAFHKNTPSADPFQAYLSYLREADAKDVTEDSKLMPLLDIPRGHALRSDVFQAVKRKAFFLVNDTLVPANGGIGTHDWDGINIYFSYNMRKVAPHLRIDFNILVDRVLKHTGYVEFYLGEVHGKGRAVSNLEYKIVGEGDSAYVKLSWDTQGGVGSNVRVPASITSSPNIQATMEELRQSLIPHRVRLALKPQGRNFDQDTQEALIEVLKSLPSGMYDQTPYKPWAPYCGNSGEVEFKYNAEFSRHELITRGAILTRFQPNDIFIDPREAEIKLCYGINNEHNLETEALDQLQVGSHRSLFLMVGTERKSSILAIVHLSRRPMLGNNQLRIPDKTFFDLSWTISSSDVKHTCKAMSTANIFGVKSDSLVLVVIGKPSRYFEGIAIPFEEYSMAPTYEEEAPQTSFKAPQQHSWHNSTVTAQSKTPAGGDSKATEPSKEPAWMDAKHDTAPQWQTVQVDEKPPEFHAVKLTPVANDAGVRRQIDAVHKLCSVREGEKEDTTHRRWWPVLLNQKLEDAEPIDPTAQQPDKAIVDRAYTTVREILPWNAEQTAILNAATAIPGGVLLAHGPGGTGKTTVQCGVAGFYLLSEIHVLMTAPTHGTTDVIADAYMKLFPELAPPIRVYPPAQEKQQVLNPRSDDDKPTELELGEEASIRIIGIMAHINSIKEDIHHARFRLDTISLESNVLKHAQAKDLTLLMPYGVGPDEKPGPPVDMWSEMRRFLNEATEGVDEMNPKELKRFMLCFKYVKRHVIRNANFIVTTTNTAVCEDIRGSFGLSAKGIVVFFDEAAFEREGNTWCPITKLDAHEKISAMLMFGDEKQLPPTVISDSGRPLFNEFTSTLGNALYTRLRALGHTTFPLHEQRRMHSAISKFPNMRSYHGMLRDGPNCHGPLEPTLACIMREWLHIRVDRYDKTDRKLRCAFVNVNHSHSDINPNTQSRYNAANHAEGMDLVEALLTGGVDGHRIRVITQYKDQARLYSQSLVQLRARRHLSYDNTPNVCTVDAAMGKESDIVIWDTVVTSANTRAELGFILDEHRCTVAATRARQVLVILGCRKILSGRLIESWKENKGARFSETAEGEVPNPKPFIIAYIEYLSQNRAAYWR